jgi:large-conductance mechanosensitive channel
MTEVNTKFGMSSDVYANVVVGIVYFFIIACAFFVQYKLMFRKKKAKPDFINCESNKEVK